MGRLNPWTSYRQTAIQTATPGQLVLQLYDGAISFLERALRGFELEDPKQSIETIHNNITRARAIVEELNLSLDMCRGGEFSENMRRLYNYCDTLLEEANMTKKPDGIRDVLRRFHILRDAWNAMLTQQVVVPMEPSAALAATG
jgi:flagellar protein FliS